MFNLYQIITGAQGGQALDNMAQRFGLSRDQADSAVKALLPALSTAFMAKAMHPGGMQEIAGAMANDQHKQAYADPGVAHAPETQQQGGAIASSVFGNSAVVQQVLQQASRFTGIPVETLAQMLPVIVSIVLGGVATAMHNQGLGAWLGQLAGSGFGNMFGQGGSSAGSAGNVLGNILGSLFGGGGAAQTSAPGQQAGAATSPMGMPPAMQAGMEAFGKMFQAGVPGVPGAAQMGDLGAQISSILSGKRG